MPELLADRPQLKMLAMSRARLDSAGSTASLPALRIRHIVAWLGFTSRARSAAWVLQEGQA